VFVGFLQIEGSKGMRSLPEENIYGHTKKLTFILEHLNGYMNLHGEPISVLDFGCGNGTAVSQFLIQEGVRYYGVDCHEPSLSYARKHYQHENAKFLNHTPEGILFDVIVYADILEHLENPLVVLQEHSNMLKEGGMIIGSVPNGRGPFEKEKRIDKLFALSAGIRLAAGIKRRLISPGPLRTEIIPYNSDSGHAQLFSRRSLFSTLNQGGFEIECFGKGGFLGGPLSERVLRGAWIQNMNSKIGDFLPYWAVSTWYFTAKKKTSDNIEKISLRTLPRILESGKWMMGRRFDIECENIKAIANKELLELWLYWRRVEYWEWVDSKGRILKCQTLPKIIMNLFRDLLLWPFIYWKILRDITRLGKTTHSQAVLNTTPCVLFLRTDHWFNIISGGSVGHLIGVIRGLKNFGYKTHVVNTDQLKGIEEDEHFHLCEPTYRVGRNIPNILEILYNDQLLSFIDERWSAWTPSFIYQRYSLGNYTGAVLKKKYTVPYICEYNGSFLWMGRQWGKGKLLHEKLINRIELLNLNTADLVTVVSQPMKDELVGRGIETEKILVNPNGVDPERYSPDIDGSGIRRQHNLDRKTVIGFIGTFGKWHGAEVLAEAFGRLLQEYPNYRNKVRLLMIGDGIMMHEVKARLKKLEVVESATLTGLVPQEEGPSHLAACDILVASHVPNPDGTPFFGSPTKLFEYMAMGKGIVASDLDQIGDVLKHDQTAWMVKPGDAESLMAGLKILIDDEHLRNRLGKAARQEVIAKYTWKEHTRKIIEKLKECVR
jgi:glycosyltransferase involved in cell wall biosynthesis/SAM-dependent methyltransferase